MKHNALLIMAGIICLQGCTTEIVRSDGSVTSKPIIERKADYETRNVCQNGQYYMLYTDGNGKKGFVGPLDNAGHCMPGETTK